MCGLAGIIRLNSGLPLAGDEAVILDRMTDIQTHRGPDDRGMFLHPELGVGLGHRRLSIIELSAAGHQPMTDGPFTLIFNGEIYNYIEVRSELQSLGHRFQSGSDTEVILKAYAQWGESCVTHFNGMWAFALWDDRAQHLFCSRDRFGVKPFYYYSHGDVFLFASEIKAILEHPAVMRRVNQRALFHFLASGWGYVEVEDQTLFNGILQLQPGHNLIVDRRGAHIKKYWNLSLELNAADDSNALARFTELFEDAVRLRLRSDVPIGSSLSGGLDSSAVTWSAVQQLPAGNSILKTFSFRSNVPACDEGEFIQACVDKLSVENVSVCAEDLLPSLIEKMLWHHDTPYAGASVLAQWFVMKVAHEHGIKVLLVGQGADETLGGYAKFLPYRLAGLLLSARITQARRERMQMLASPFAQGLDLSWRRGLRGAASWIAAQNGIRRRSLPHDLAPYLRAEAFPNQDWIEAPTIRSGGPLQRELFMSVTLSPLPALLHNDDRNSMAHSVETRSPFMDYRLVQFGFALSDEHKIRGAESKHVLRQYLEHRLPAIARRSDKKGFATPAAQWFRDGLRQWSMDIVGSRSFRERGFFNCSRIETMLSEHQAGVKDWSAVLWSILNLEVWHRIFID